MLKDYYKILEVSPNASTVDIKKSYRRLALRYHPDKTFGNKALEAKFKEITEAYKVLTDLRQRQEYNIKVNFYNHAEKKKQPPPPPTAAAILQQAIVFRKKIAVLDPERMNKRALYQRIQQLLAKQNMEILQLNNDMVLNKKIIREILFCSRHLPFPQVEKICYQLTALAGTDNTVYKTLYDFSKETKRREFWNKYKLMIALAITFVLCGLIYFISERY